MSDPSVTSAPPLQLQPLAPESSLSYSVSSHLDSSPESSEAGADIPLLQSGERFRNHALRVRGGTIRSWVKTVNIYIFF